jgi:hypothetical protein
MSKKEFESSPQKSEEILEVPESGILPQHLLEIVTEEMKKQLPVTLNGEDPVKIAARQRVLSFMVDLEYQDQSSLNGHIEKAIKHNLQGRWPEKDAGDNSPRVEELCDKYKDCVDENDVDFIPDIDREVAPGGLSRIFLAAMDGEMDEVQRLYNAGARLDLLDNNGCTLQKKARLMGHPSIAEWIEKQPPVKPV